MQAKTPQKLPDPSAEKLSSGGAAAAAAVDEAKSDTREETVVVKKPLGVRIHKNTLRVTYIEPNAAAAGEMYMGDKIVALDSQPIKNLQELNQKLKESAPTVAVRVERGATSWCKYLGTTIEMLQLDKDVIKATGRAIDVIKVCLNFRFLLDMEDHKEDVLQMSIKYDARERVQIASCEAGGLAAVHLRPGDLIRDVNDHQIASKEMLQHYFMEGITEGNGKVCLTVERAAGGDDAFRDQIEMSADVLSIAQKQIAAFKSGTCNMKPKSVYKLPAASTPPKSVKVSNDAPQELLIQSDHDPATLKSCKSANK